MKIALIAALGALVALPAAAQQQQLPQRKPGLWETKSVGNEGETLAKQCVGPGTDQSIVGGLTAGACSKMLVTKTAMGYAVETECAVGQIRASGSSVITGDFETSVRTEGTTKLSGMPGQSGPVERKLVVEAKRLGECAAGQKPGDIIMPDGKVISMPSKPAP
uniref:DUF3617 family protein n=1 Tax=Bosea sp. NBC_00436 TaxID=2969620 RepID=A0A9E8CRM2_9HYPH